ncbi:MAG TPA: arylsulfotransferase family protein [Solirubrobacteraceae bacterium]|nr:arylsulfotransferase family protein [Solirubrobacteraceae bacterium]
MEGKRLLQWPRTAGPGPIAATAIAVSIALAGFGFTAPARALTVSPLPGTPDASPVTQISFLGTPASNVRHVSVTGSRSGSHAGSLKAYASAPGASFLPSRPFAAGESVRASAVLAPHDRRVTWTFQIAHQLPDPTSANATVAAVAAKPGTVQSFVSQPQLQPPILQVSVDSPAVAPGYVFLTPSNGYGQPGAMIAEDNGALVWFQPAPPGMEATNLQVQRYEGSSVLVWWQGRVLDGVGFGRDEIYDSSYRPVAEVKAGNGYEADLHALQITPQGSAFITAYSIVRADLSSVGGARDALLQDAVVQEIDVRTGLVMFEWHADGHVSLADSHYKRGPSDRPWDYFHVNSISLDPWEDGNFIISSRNTWTAYEIDHHSGSILWRLGGRHSTFHMGPGTGTAWQHDVEWQPDRTLTIFDNGAVPTVHPQSRAIHEAIDWKHRSVALVDRDYHTPPLRSGSQGDDETLPNGDSFVGWGERPYMSEFGPDGQIVFDAHIFEPGQSYRAFRFQWEGVPWFPPALALTRTPDDVVTAYASWNGATGVASWELLAGPGPGALSPVASAPRTGFETAVTVRTGQGWFVAQALDSAGRVMGQSAPTHG